MRNLLILALSLLIGQAALADPQVKAVSLSRLAPGGNVIQGKVVLQQPAADENVWVELRSDGPLHVPIAVRIPAGQDSATFTVCIDPVEHGQVASVQASVRGHGPLCQVKVQPAVSAAR